MAVKLQLNFGGSTTPLEAARWAARWHLSKGSFDQTDDVVGPSGVHPSSFEGVTVG